MTKKENEAIELLKQPPEMPFIYCERENAIGIVLKLVEKQQKEIEREKQYSYFYKDLCDKQQKVIEKSIKFKKDIVNMIMFWDKKELPENNAILETLKTIMHEFSRLENIEDKKIEVAVDFVNEKRDKYWKDKIRELIKERAKPDTYNFKTIAVKDLEELLEENNNEY